MRVADDDDLLRTSLDELSALAGAEDRAVLGALRARLQERRLRVWSPGRPSGGRARWSTPCSGAWCCRSGVTPLTALATSVRYGADEAVTAVFGDGRTESFRCPRWRTSSPNAAIPATAAASRR